MFAEIAKPLLRMMGMTGDVPGALQPEDVPAALERLRKAVGAAPQPDDHSKDDSPRVGLSTRAFPLIRLLEAAARKKQYVMWEERPADSPSPD
jgi:hypothetical protein